MALFVLCFMGIMPLGSLAFGALGNAIGVPEAVAAGQVVVLAWGALLWARRGLLDGLDVRSSGGTHGRGEAAPGPPDGTGD